MNTRPLKMLACAAALALAPLATAAQSVVGTTIVDGRQVQLLSNNTWQFVSESDLASSCDRIEGPVSFCGSAQRWRRAPVAPNPSIDRLYQLDDRNFAMLIVEGVGPADGLSMETLRSLVIQNAASAAGVAANAIPVLDSFETLIEGKPFPTIAYRVNLQGLVFVYQTTLWQDDRNSGQITTYAISGELTDTQRALHAEFAGDVRILD